MSGRVVSIGDLVADLITPVHLPVRPFDHQETRGAYLEAGGACNFNIMARRLGLDVLALGAIGDDMFGAELRRILSAEGIDLRGAITHPGSRSCLVLDLIDQRTHEHVFIGNLATGPVVEYTPELDSLVTSAGAVFAQGYNLHEEQLPLLMDGAMTSARAHNIPVFCDTGPTLRTIDPARVRRMAELTDIAMMTADEVPLVAEGHNGEVAYRYLFDLGVQTIVIKRGADGCTVIQPDARFDSPGFAVEVVDTVGAGDCFNAGLIYARLNGLDWADAARIANACGAASVQKSGGGRNAPTRAEVETLLSRHHLRLPT
ncbi:MAG: carbohydrate kinase family protein [Anaerolineae bacterium]|nr:carbohydrate kinase family protein [Anaerolineae bacterium]